MAGTTYTVTNSFSADTTAIASQVNANFTDVLTALNALNAANLSSGTLPLARISGLTVTQLAAATIVLEAEGIGSNDNDITWPTCAAVKDFVDTQIAAGIPTGEAPTLEDSNADAMIKSHAYKAQTLGIVNAYAIYPINLIGYVDTDTNPAVGGAVIARSSTAIGGQYNGITFVVPKDYYFEIVANSGTPTIYWTSLIGSGGAPIDQD